MFLFGMLVFASGVGFLLMLVEVGKTRGLSSDVFDVGLVVNRETNFIGRVLSVDGATNDIVSKSPFRLRMTDSGTVLYCYWLPIFVPQIVSPFAAKCRMTFRDGNAEVTVRLQRVGFVLLQLLFGGFLAGVIYSMHAHSTIGLRLKLLYALAGILMITIANSLLIQLEIRRARVATDCVLGWLRRTGHLVPMDHNR